MPSSDPGYLNRLTFGAAEISTIHRLGEAPGRQDLFVRQFREQLEELRTNAIIESTESSNRIEGVTAAQGRADPCRRGIRGARAHASNELGAQFDRDTRLRIAMRPDAAADPLARLEDDEPYALVVQGACCSDTGQRRRRRGYIESQVTSPR